jgi:hypothetical protein
MSAFAWSLLGAAIIQLLILALIAAILTSIVLLVLGTVYGMDSLGLIEYCVVLLAVGFTGIVVGYLGGLSRTSAVGNIVPAVLTLAGGLSVYLFGLKRPESKVTNLAFLAFVLAFFIGYSYAANLRTDDEAFTFCRDKYTEAALISNERAFVQFNQQFHDYCTDIFARHINLNQPKGLSPPPVPPPEK